MIGYLMQIEIKRHFAEQDARELRVITDAVEAALQTAKSKDLASKETLSHAVSGHHDV